MSTRRTKRAAAQGKSYAQPNQRNIYRAGTAQWQEDWCSVPETPPALKRRKGDALAITATLPVMTPPAASRMMALPPAPAVLQTAEQRAAELLAFVAAERNANTSATYASAWKQFERWAMETENPTRAAGEQMDVQRPTETDVCNYMRHMATVKQSPMSSIGIALSGIADHLRFVTDERYHPCSGKLIDAVRAVLTPRATPSKQKQEMDWPRLWRIATAAETGAATTASERVKTQAMRDRCLIMLSYFCFLRTSETARMRRGDITIAMGETGKRVLTVHVNRLCKNDKERLGHDRLVQERETEAPFCMLRCMEQWLAHTAHLDAAAPLFPCDDGTQMSADTPRSRLKHWLGVIENPDSTVFSFHSLRAGAATAAARAGVPVQMIKLHGNWASDAVYAYIRPGEFERTSASSALGPPGAAAAAQP